MTLDIFTMADIHGAVEQHAGEQDPASLQLWQSDVVSGLEALQSSLEAHWRDHLDAIDSSDVQVVHEDSTVMVLADHTGHGWQEERDALELGDERGRIVQSVHYRAAKRLCEFSWESATPFVVVKPDAWRVGELHVERRVGQIARAADVSEAAAMDYWSVEVQGRSQSEWARLVGKTQQTVSENIQKVVSGI